MSKILLSILTALIGFGVFVFSIYKIIDYKEKNKTYIEIEGTVIGYSERDDDQVALIVEYKIDDKTYTKSPNYSTNHPKKIGTKIKIKYNPDNPEDIIWVKDSSNIVLPIVGVLFTGIGIYATIDNYKRYKKYGKGA